MGTSINIFYDSPEAEKLRRLILSKETYLKTLALANNKSAYQIVQTETMFLKNSILPIVLNNTSIIHNEACKYFIRAFDSAINHKCYGMLMYLPIDENYTDYPKIGIANIRANLGLGKLGAMEIFAEVINMDGNGAPPQPFNLNLDVLI